jgi:hypothetical protein
MASRSGLPAGREPARPRARRLGPTILLTTLLMALQLGFAPFAGADGGDFSLDFASATPGTYNQTTGTGGTWDDVVQQLNGGDFTCGDVVQHLTEVVVDDGATGTQDIAITYSFDTETTSGGQVGYGDVTYASINLNDPNNQLSGNETVTLVSEETVGEEIIATVEVTGLEAGEVLIVSVGAQLACNEDPADVTGNIHATLESAETSEGDPINTGNDDTPLIQVGQITPPEPVPAIAVVKECPDVVTVGGEITYTVTITNTGEEPLEDIQVVDSLFGDISDLFDDTLDVGESDTVERSFIVPANLGGQTLTNEVTVTATGAESEVEATASTACETEIREPGGPGEEPELPVTGFAGGLPLVWIFLLASAVVIAGAGLRVAARRRG